MKESSWESSTEDSSEYFDSEALLNEDDASDLTASDLNNPKQSKMKRMTELRRRMEMRLDWKRISSEVDYLQDESQDKLQ